MHYGDLRDPQSINNVVSSVRPDYTFHLAAQSYPKTSFDAPLDTYETNISGTSTLLEAIKNFLKIHKYMYAHLRRFLEGSQKKKHLLMKNVLFILLRHIQFQGRNGFNRKILCRSF